MKTTQWLVRRSAIIIAGAHLAVFISFFFPDYWGWQAICGCSLPLRSPIWFSPPQLIVSTLALAVLIIPPLSAWLISRSPTSLPGLFGLWISLPLTLLFGLIGFLQLYWISKPLYWRPSPFYWIPPLAFALSFLLCLALALVLPLQRRQQISAGEQERAGFGSPAEDEYARSSEERVRPRPTGMSWLLALLISLGLLAHALILASLFLPYLVYYDAYSLGPEITSTGWQLLAQPFLPPSGTRISIMPAPSATLVITLLAMLLLPAFCYLVSLVLVPFKGKLRDTLLKGSLYTGYVLVIAGLLLSAFCLAVAALDRGGDLSDPYQNTQGAFTLPPLAFLLSLLCCGILLRLLQRPSPRRLS